MSKPEFNPKKETAFIKKVVEGLIDDLTKEVLKTDFNSLSSKKSFVRKSAIIISQYGKEYEKKLFKQLGFDWNEEVQDALFDLKGVDPTIANIPNKNDLKFIFSLEKLTRDTKDEIEGLFSNSINTLKRNLNFYDQTIRQDVLSKIAQGGFRGSSLKDISADIQQEFLKNGITGFESTTGRKYKLEGAMDRLARQTLITGRQRAVMFESISQGHDLIKISGHSDPSPMCQQFQNQIYSITGITKGYPLIQSALWNGTYKRGSGVGHPQCRHTFMIHIPTNIKFV